MWGYFGQGETIDAFWGPRDIAVDGEGRVFVTDTGNKRIAVFSEDGTPLTQFGEVGLGPEGRLYVADTWNQRVQVFEPGEGDTFSPVASWDIAGWYGQSLDNKPYLAVDDQGNVFVGDPEGGRVLQFTRDGQFVRYWGDLTSGPGGFGQVGSVAVDPDGSVWVSDAGNGRIMHFTLP
jgi:DNA-binding beta-propeller fold protein YncE